MSKFTSVIISLVFCILILMSPLLFSQEKASFYVNETEGLTRTREYIQAGIPVPRIYSWRDVSNLKLVNTKTGSVVPAEFEVLDRWGSTPDDIYAPVKWALVKFFTNAAANEKLQFHIESTCGASIGDQKITLSQNEEYIRVNTGAARFEILTGYDFNLFNMVHPGASGGNSIVTPISPTEAVQYLDIAGLSIVDDPSYTPDLTERVASTDVETSSPVCTVLKHVGSLRDSSSRTVLDYTVRMYFYAGSPTVRVDFTLENNQPIIEGDWGQPLNVHDQQTTGSVFIGGMKLNLQLAESGSTLHTFTEGDVHVDALTSLLKLHQDSSGTDYWDVYVGMVGWPGFEINANPRLQSYCTIPGYEVTGSDLASPITGDQALGFMAACHEGGEAPCLGTLIPGMDDNFPKSIEISPAGRLSVDLFPDGNKFRHNFRPGEEKTHTVYFNFSNGIPSAYGFEDYAERLDNPLVVTYPQDEIINTGVLGEVPSMNIPEWPLYERYVRTAFEQNPDFDPNVHDPNYGNRTLTQILEEYNFYGWQDYGDVPLDYEAFGDNQAGQMNLKYWFLYGMWMQFLRSGDSRWFDLAEPAAWHIADIDTLHIPDEGIQHWSHGCYFGHSTHNEPGNWNPNRNYNSPAVDLFYGPPGLLLAYHVTGEKRFLDSTKELLEAMLNHSTMFYTYTEPVPERNRANMIFAMTEGYRRFKDARYFNELNRVVSKTADLSNKSWFTSPTVFLADNPDYPYVRMFMLNQVAWSFGKYLDFLHEYNISNDNGALNFLKAYSDFMLNYAMVEYEPGRAAHYYDHYFDGNPPEWVELDINSWALVAADALAYTYKYTGEKKYLDAAKKFYATGTIDPVWPGDPPVYLSTKDLVNPCNWGLVYMNQTKPVAGPNTGWMWY